jgi:RNA-directed DNA polymerase
MNRSCDIGCTTRAGFRRPLEGVHYETTVPTVLDRFIQQALRQVLQRQWDPTFSEHPYGFRPGRSAHQAVAQAQPYIAEGYRVVADLDLEKFFDRVNHDKLRGAVAQRITDQRVWKLIRAFLNAGMREGGLVGPRVEGTPQGGPLSPLLSNIVLDELDRELEQRGHRFVRYADDGNIYVRSLRAGQRVRNRGTRFLATQLTLKVHSEKSAVALPRERKFLGFSFTGPAEPKRRMAPKAVKRFQERVREIPRRRKGHGRGKRLRCLFWIPGKTGRKRFDELVQRGVDRPLAATTAGSHHGPWRLSGSLAVSPALSHAFFDSLGLPKLAVGR